MTINILSLIPLPSNSRANLFLLLMLVLHLGLTNPLSPSAALLHANPGGNSTNTSGSAKVFKAMRKRWNEVVPVLKRCVDEADVVRGDTMGVVKGKEGMHQMPSDGWEERLGTAATAVLYEICRVQRLNSSELGSCTFS
jgi:hypothetical protein